MRNKLYRVQLFLPLVQYSVRHPYTDRCQPCRAAWHFQVCNSQYPHRKQFSFPSQLLTAQKEARCGHPAQSTGGRTGSSGATGSPASFRSERPRKVLIQEVTLSLVFSPAQAVSPLSFPRIFTGRWYFPQMQVSSRSMTGSNSSRQRTSSRPVRNSTASFSGNG